jgi:hypothetical protein
MIDRMTETLIPIEQVPDELPSNPHPSTVHRWRLRGIAGVKLETLKIGGRRFTSKEAIERFINASTAASDKS